MRLSRLVIFVLTVLLSTTAFAQTDPTITATYTFNSAVRSGSWTPLIVTVNDPLSRNLDLKIDTATGSPIGASIHVPITTYGVATSYTVYVPTTGGYGYPDVSIELRDPNTGRRVGDSHLVAPLTNYWQQGLTFALVMPPGHSTFIQANYERATDGMQIGVLPPANLPLNQIGYEGIDVLMLYGVDLNKLDAQAQQSIVSWIEGGGRLIYWPADHILNPNAPLAKILPAKIGAIDSLNIASPNSTRQSSAGGNSILARTLSPIGSAERVTFDENFPGSIQSNFGLGRVCVLPVDVFDLRTGETQGDQSFAIDVLKGMVEFKQAYPSSKKLAPVLHNVIGGARWASDSSARQTIFAQLANVADLKTFNLSLLLWMMLGLTILVGPVDWIVLRALRRQPWTWFTTLGWAGVATLGAALLAMTGRGGSSTYRSMTLIDQLEGRTIARTQLACLYSSETRKFEIEQNSPTWWRIPWNGSFRNERAGSFVDFFQSAQANSIMPFTIRQWNVIVLESQTFGDDGLKLETRLSLNNNQITGAIRNSSSWSIKSLALVSSTGALQFNGTIPPGESIDISQAQSITTDAALQRWPEIAVGRQSFSNPSSIVPENSNRVLLLARFENFDGPNLTDNANIEEEHFAVVRGIIHLKAGDHE